MSTITRRLAVLLAVLSVAVLAVAGTASAHPRNASFGATTLVLDPGAAAALNSLGVAPGVVAPATASADGLAFPITTPVFGALVTRQIRHSGGISLTAGSTQVTLTDFIINLDRDPDLTAVVNGGPRVSILDLSLAGASLRLRGGLTLGPVTGTLTQAAADALNGAFHVNAFAKGLKLGQATVRYAPFGRWS